MGKMLIDNLYQNFADRYSVVLIDPHAALPSMLGQVPTHQSVDFNNIRTDLFLNIGEPVFSTELTSDLFSALLNTKANPQLERTLRYSLSSLFQLGRMSLTNLKMLLTDTLFRQQLLKTNIDSSTLKFFETEY